MLTIFISSQCDHRWWWLLLYEYRNNSLSFSWHLPPPPVVSRGRLSRVLPALRLLLPLSFFPRLPSLTPRSPTSTRWTTNRNGVSRSSNIATRRQSFKSSIYKKRCCARARAYVSTQQRLHGVNYKRGSASGRGPSGGDQRHWRLKTKRQRQEHVPPWQQFTRAEFRVVDSRQNLDTNQSN